MSAAAAAVIAANLLHHTGGVLPQAAGPHPSVSASPTAALRVSPSAVASAPAVVPISERGGGTSAATSASPRSSPSHRPSPAPHPSPDGPGLVQVGAAVAVSLRGTTPVSVRLPLAVPTGPPPPSLDLGALLPGLGG